MSSIRRQSCPTRWSWCVAALVAVFLIAVALAGGAQAQGFTRAPITNDQVPPLPSIALVVNLVNGTSYCTYTVGGSPGINAVKYATKPAGGAWTEEDTQVWAKDVAITTTQFTQGNVVPHLAIADFYKTGTPDLQGTMLWASRSTSGVWTYEVVDPGLTTECQSVWIGLSSSNVPRIAYWVVDPSGADYSRLKLARRLGANAWQIEVVDSVAAGSFDDVTVRMWNGPEILTYGRLAAGAPTYEFIYAFKSGSNWVKEEIEPTASNPQNGAMMLPANGIAHVAYWTNDGMLNYAYRLSVNNWVRTKLRPALALNADRSISIAQGPSNEPSIAYFSVNGDSLRYASKKSNRWNYQQVAQAGGDFGPISVGVHSATQTMPKIAHVGYDEIGTRTYFLAEGIQSFSGNSSARQAREEQPAAGAGLSIVGSGVVPGGVVALRLGQVEGGEVEFDLVDVAGRVIARRAPEWLDAGPHEVVWDVGSPPAGMYFVHMRTRAGARATAKLVIAR